MEDNVHKSIYPKSRFLYVHMYEFTQMHVAMYK